MIDPRISMGVRTANVSPAIDIFNNALNNSQLRAQRQQQMDQNALLNPLQVQAKEQAVQQGKLNLQNETDRRDLTSIANFYDLKKDVFESGNPEAIRQELLNRKASLQASGRSPEQMVQTDEALQMLESGDTQRVVNSFRNANKIARENKLISGSTSAAERERKQLITDAQSDDPLLRDSARIKLGLDPRAVGSANQTIAESGNVKEVANVVGELSQAGEGGKLEAQTQKLPNIKKLVKQAEISAAKTGEVMTDLNRAKAALPGITEVVGKLKELAPIVTSTIGGSIYDKAAKELGFGSTKGATAKAKFTAMIDNQVLPLLRDTFGAAFTAPEGDRLRDAMGNPDASPEQKIAQLDGFIEQKMRSIETSERELEGLVGGNNQTTEQPQVLRFDAQGNLIQ